MYSVVFLLIFFFAASAFGYLDLDSKARNFSVELLYHTLQDSDSDIIISPYSIWYLLISIAYETLGATRKQILKALLLPEDRNEVVKKFQKLNTSMFVDKCVTISWRNYLFYEENSNVYSDSIKRLQNDFGFVTRPLNFEEPYNAAYTAMEDIFDVDNSPTSLTLLIIRPRDFVDSAMIMGNSLIFVAKWSKQLHVTHLARGVINMKASLRFSNFESLHASVTEMPYEGGQYCMLLIRPHNGYDVKQVFRNIRDVSLKDILVSLQRDADEFGLREIDIELPEDIVSTLSLSEPVSKIGLSDVFDKNLANFDNFAEDKIHIGEISHRIDIFFNKLTTVVYSFIPAQVSPKRIIIREKKVAVKDPFIFFIIEKSTATILFSGSYSKIT